MSLRQSLNYTGSTKSTHVDFTTQSLRGFGYLLQTLIQEVRPDTKFQIEITAEDEESLLKGYYTRTGKYPENPVLRIFPENTQAAEITLNRHIMLTDGIKIGLSKDRAHSIIMHAFPFILTVNVSLLTTDYDLIRDFIRILQFNSSDAVEFSLDINDPRYSIPIKIQFDTNYTYPPREDIEGYGKAYRFNFIAGIRTFVARLEYIPNMARVSFQPIVSGANNYKEKLKELESNVEKGEHWEPDEFTYTINLRDRATSSTID